MKKYTVDYKNCATDYGWSSEHDGLDEFEGLTNELRNDYMTMIHVWDSELEKFIFWKDCLTHYPRIDMLHTIERDMRTKTRTARMFCEQ